MEGLSRTHLCTLSTYHEYTGTTYTLHGAMSFGALYMHILIRTSPPDFLSNLLYLKCRILGDKVMQQLSYFISYIPIIFRRPRKRNMISPK